jgi:hypothetical protein
MINYLMCDEPDEKRRLFTFVFPFGKKKTSHENALSKYKALEILAEPHLSSDPVMPAMLAWAKRMFIYDDLSKDRMSECEAGLKELADFLDKYDDNPLVANEYACAYTDYFISRVGELPRELSDEIIDELERITLDYNEMYDAIAENGRSDLFPNYAPGHLDSHFLKALTELAAEKYAKTNDINGLLNILNRLGRMTYSACVSGLYHRALGQIYSNLVYLYGNSGDFQNAKKSVDSIRSLAAKEKQEEDEHWDAYKSLILSLSDALYNLITDYAESHEPDRNDRMDALLAELKELSNDTDDAHLRIRYASSLFNICVNSPEDVASMQRKKAYWECLYLYVISNDVGETVAASVAEGEAILVAKAGESGDMEAPKNHRSRARAIAECGYYNQYNEIHTQAAAADFNLLTIAGAGGDMGLAKNMFHSLVENAAAHPENRGVILRLAKGALNLITDNGDAGELATEDAIFQTMLPYVLPYADDSEIALRLVNAAFNLSIDIVNSGDCNRVTMIYDAVKHARIDDETVVKRLNDIRKMAGVS